MPVIYSSSVFSRVKIPVDFSAKLIEFFILFLVVATPLIFSSNTYELFEFPKMLIAYFGSILILGTWLIDNLISKRFRLAKSILLIPIFLYLVSQTISSVFSIDPHTSLFGYYSRFNGGLFSQIAYISIFLASISYLTKTAVFRILTAIVLTATFVAIWGIPSHFGTDPTCKLVVGNWSIDCWSIDFNPRLRIFSTLGQPNWLAAYLAFVIPVSVSLLLTAKSIFKKFFFAAAVVIQYFAFLLTNSRAASLGLGIGALVFMVLFFLSQRKSSLDLIKKNLSFLLISLSLFLLLTFFFGQQLLGRVKEAGNTINQNTNAPQNAAPSQTALVSQGTESGKIRFIVWKGAIETFRHFPVFGSGVETFGYIYYQYRPIEHNNTTEWNFLYNKAHNEYLNYLATSGLIGLIAYIGLIAAYLFLSLRYLLARSLKGHILNDKILVLGLLAGYVAYLIQNFFGFSVVSISLLFFLFPAIFLIIANKKLDYFELALHAKLAKYLPILSPIIVAFCFLLTIFILRIYLSDVAFSKGKQYESFGAANLALSKLEEANNLSPVGEPLFLSNLANVAAQTATSVEDERDKLIELAVNASTKALKISPLNQTVLRQTAETYFYLSFADPAYASKAISIFQTAANFAPTDPDLPYQIAIIQHLSGDNKSAISSLKKSLELKPDLQKAKDKLTEYQSEAQQ